MMTKKDFIKIAEILARLKGKIQEPLFSELVDSFSLILKADNYQFSRYKFLEAIYEKMEE